MSDQVLQSKSAAATERFFKCASAEKTGDDMPSVHAGRS